MTQVLHTMSRALGGLDVRDLVLQTENRSPSHAVAVRPTPATMKQRYLLNEALIQPAPTAIGIFDDVLTTGCQFKAIRELLMDRFPGVAIVGFFWARRVPGPDAAQQT